MSNYETLLSVSARNGEIIISRVRKKGVSDSLSISPRKSYFNDEGQPDKYIPRNSSTLFGDVAQVADFINSLRKACIDVFGEEPV